MNFWSSVRPARRPVSRFRPQFEALETRTVPTLLLGLTTANTLVTFDSANPGTILRTLPVTGLASGETLLGIDTRPATGGVYGVGSTNQLYLLNPTNGAATPVGGPFAPPGPALTGTANGFDFNPVPDAIRVTSNANQNLRLNPNTGQVNDGDPNTPGIQGDANLNPAGRIVGSAYTNNVAGATTTTLYGIDSATDRLVGQGGLDFPTNPPSPNTGQLFDVAALGFDTDDRVGFDVDARGTAFASLTAPGATSSQLFTINLMPAAGTTAATSLGTIGGGVALRGLTALGFVAPPNNPTPVRGPGTPPAVEVVAVGDGVIQRSQVTSIRVMFNTTVNVPAMAFSLQVRGGRRLRPIAVNVASTVVNDKTVVTLTFTGRNAPLGSLRDGNYVLSVLRDQLRDAAGRAVDGGGPLLVRFFRLFGGADGNRRVSRADRRLFQSTLGKAAGDQGFLGFFDFNRDGIVNGFDRTQFNRRFGSQLR